MPIFGGNSSGVTSVVAGNNLNGGTITSTGTVSLQTLAASSLFGNFGTVGGTMAAVAMGTNLTLSPTGTLDATAGAGGITSLVAAAPLTGGTITSTGTVGVQTGPTFQFVGSTQPIVLQGNTAVPTLSANTAEVMIGANTVQVRRTTFTYGGATTFQNQRAEGTLGTITATGSAFAIANFYGSAYDGTVYGGGIGLQVLTSEIQSTGSHGMQVLLSSIANGTTAIVNGFTLNGSLSTLMNLNVGGTLAAFPVGANMTVVAGSLAVFASPTFTNLNVGGTLGSFPTGLGLSLNNGSISAHKQITVAATAGTNNITLAADTTNVLINGPAAGGACTLTLTGAVAIDQRIVMNVSQGATAATWVFGTGFNFGTTVPSPTITAVAAKRDTMALINNIGTVFDMDAIVQGFSP